MLQIFHSYVWPNVFVAFNAVKFEFFLFFCSTPFPTPGGRSLPDSAFFWTRFMLFGQHGNDQPLSRVLVGKDTDDHFQPDQIFLTRILINRLGIYSLWRVFLHHNRIKGWF